MIKSSYPESVQIFDRETLRLKKENCSRDFANYNFLFDLAAKEISERLMDVNRHFANTLQIGSRGVMTPDHPQIDDLVTMDITPKPITAAPPYIQGDEELLPIKSQSLDLALSILNLHSVNDLPGALIQIRNVLKPDGLFMACLFGGETLHEFRQSLTHSEIEIHGGVSPRIFPFADKMQIGSLLQRAGFALPVIDSDIIKVSYNSMFDLIKDIRGMGEGNIISKRNKSYAGKSLFLEAAKYYQENFPAPDNKNKIEASFEIIYMAGWAPHSSQQKPLQPGSAEYSLEQALNNPEPKE
tara:strand:+ start:201 stop:1094 length:894 start_codon:yes stop_codon:yes gene_type:complete